MNADPKPVIVIKAQPDALVRSLIKTDASGAELRGCMEADFQEALDRADDPNERADLLVKWIVALGRGS